jgi:hypothetical protein
LVMAASSTRDDHSPKLKVLRFGRELVQKKAQEECFNKM